MQMFNTIALKDLQRLAPGEQVLVLNMKRAEMASLKGLGFLTMGPLDGSVVVLEPATFH